VVELAEIFRRYGPHYREKYGTHMPPSHLDAMADIEQCRTEALGGQVYQCPECDEKRYSYHSCQNRHCPKCQQAAGQEWLEQQQSLLLPVPYFLLTFTLPEELREVARRHQKLVYGLLFRASATAAQQLAQDPRFVGGTLGMVGVLHT
jgi:Transposase zinc-binding domain